MPFRARPISTPQPRKELLLKMKWEERLLMLNSSPGTKLLSKVVIFLKNVPRPAAAAGNDLRSRGRKLSAYSKNLITVYMHRQGRKVCFALLYFQM